MTVRFFSLSVILIGLAAGCGGGIEKAPVAGGVPVTGTVTLDGKPVGGCRIIYFPTLSSQGDGASGTTDSAGKYELTSLLGNETAVGAPPGSYKVVISRMLRPDGSALPPDSQEPPMMSGARESIPIKYSDFNATQLSATVASSGGTFDFEIKSK